MKHSGASKMLLKNFYKRNREKKLFFDKAIKYRSVCYGERVFSEYQEWLEYFREKKKNKRNNLFLSQKGEINGSTCTYTGKRYLGESNLSPLTCEEKVFEFSNKGFLYINGVKNLYAGEVRACALMSLPGKSERELKLAVLATDNVGTTLKCYDVTKEGEEKNVISVQLEGIRDSANCLVCLEKNIFLIYNATFYYFYLNTQTNELEMVAVGEDEAPKDTEYTRNAAAFLAADGHGVFWFAGERLFRMEIGKPKEIEEIDVLENAELVSLCAERDMLMVKYKNKDRIKEITYRFQDDFYVRN